MSATQQSDRAATSTAADPAAMSPGSTTSAATDSDGSAPQRFRAATVEEALRRARELLGDDAEIIEANRIRRGGIGGFFATELGVEVLAQSAAGTVSDRPTAAAEPVAPGSDTEHASLGRSARGGRVDPVATAGPVTDYGSVPGRGRAAWRAASAEAAVPAPLPAMPSAAMPSLFQEMLERAAADQLAAASAAEPEADIAPARPSKIFRAWRVTDDGATPARPSMFDDEPFAGEPSGPVATPVDASPVDAPLVDTALVDTALVDTAASDTAASDTAPGAGGTAFAEHFLRELMDDAAVLRSDPARARTTQSRRRPRSDAPTLPGIGEPATEGDAAAAPAAEAPAPAARAKRPSRRRAAAPVATETPELPLEPAPITAPVTGPAAPAGALGAIVDQCLQLAAADGDGPRKVAVAVTMGDGQVVKITIEPSRGR